MPGVGRGDRHDGVVYPVCTCPVHVPWDMYWACTTWVHHHILPVTTSDTGYAGTTSPSMNGPWGSVPASDARYLRLRLLLSYSRPARTVGLRPTVRPASSR